ncbi:MAG TPA: glycosyltransferase [Pyrinomonadaceae bacterium]|nr:glycosyltransferase [Pyrinomonadaceae bacterium]
MRIVLFYQSLISDWNHGNAHFLRGIASELLARGHEVEVYEPRDSWSVQNLVAEHGREPLVNFQNTFPHLKSHRYDCRGGPSWPPQVDEKAPAIPRRGGHGGPLLQLNLDDALENAQLVIVHEWNEPELIERIGEYRRINGNFVLLFHDTHHRMAGQVTLPFSLKDYDGVLAYGQVLNDMYMRNGWTKRAWTWHEAADVRIFHPLPKIPRTLDLVWIGNWGDDERTAELHEFLVQPVKDLQLNAEVYGVRYPPEAIAELESAGIRYRGWLPNYKVPEAFASARVTLHIPRRPYVKELPGIPTIRPFEALACGIPLICSPWHDTEHLFTPGKDFLIARNGDEMKQFINKVLSEPVFAEELAINGLATIKQRHTCGHRVDELLEIYAEIVTETREMVATI